MSYLQLEGKRILVMGVGNRRSVAWQIVQELEANGATCIVGVRNRERADELGKLLGSREVVCCDVEDTASIQALGEQVQTNDQQLDGFVHSIAFANYSAGARAFHETRREDFLQAAQISAFSLVELANALKPSLHPDASVVAISISSQVLAEKYGYMSPIKACLEGCTRFLAKSFSADTRVRFNTVNAGPLKTKASAGIPGYLENYLYAEKLTLRGAAVTTEEVARTAVFLLSPLSSGINAQGIVVNAGMDLNYFDAAVVDAVTRVPNS
ncbi:MAG: enoyl-ACP reductase [Opitutales bacterium]